MDLRQLRTFVVVAEAGGFAAGESYWPEGMHPTAFYQPVARGLEIRIGEKLAEGWKIERLDKTMLQILRAGAYELLARADVPTGSVISEYLDVAHAFFDEREAKFVNGVLDAVAKDVRG